MGGRAAGKKSTAKSTAVTTKSAGVVGIAPVKETGKKNHQKADEQRGERGQFQKGNTSANGGSRANSGRKPKIVTTYREQLFKECPHALKCVVDVIKDKKNVDAATRTQNARWLIDQVIGKATRSIKHEGAVNLLGEIDQAKAAELAKLASEAMGDTDG